MGEVGLRGSGAGMEGGREGLELRVDVLMVQNGGGWREEEGKR